MQRDLLKTASFAILHFWVAFAVGYALTGSVGIAAGLGLIEPLANSVAFFFHERLWARFGHRKPPSSPPRHRCLPLDWHSSQV
ncbi:MAG TPA: DUF2061 domain-containing protein [Steroidobacteraceae bacterium]|nr:DUF2061 domain-containing protein [Steroidobacteraceae bacterium]